jgi:hypothetical protein
MLGLVGFMALQMEFLSPFTDEAFSEAYWMIEDCQVVPQLNEETNEKEYIFAASLRTYCTQTDRQNGKSAIGGGNISFVLDMDDEPIHHNIIKQTYEYLKTQEQFADAVDV